MPGLSGYREDKKAPHVPQKGATGALFGLLLKARRAAPPAFVQRAQSLIVTRASGSQARLLNSAPRRQSLGWQAGEGNPNAGGPSYDRVASRWPSRTAASADRLAASAATSAGSSTITVEP